MAGSEGIGRIKNRRRERRSELESVRGRRVSGEGARRERL